MYGDSHPIRIIGFLFAFAFMHLSKRYLWVRAKSEHKSMPRHGWCKFHCNTRDRTTLKLARCRAEGEGKKRVQSKGSSAPVEL